MNRCKECKYHTTYNSGGYDNDVCTQISGYNSIINYQVEHNLRPFYCPFNGIPQTDDGNKDITLDDCIKYFQSVLTDGGVNGTDFELEDDETEIYKMAISALKILKEKQ